MTKAQEIRIDDFKALYASIKANIDDANDELERLYVQKSLVESGFIIEQKQRIIELEKLAEKKEVLLNFISIETERIEKARAEHNAYVIECEKNFLQKEMDIFARSEEADEILEDAQEELVLLTERNKEATEEIKKTEALLSVQMEILAGTDKKIAENNRTLGLLSKDLLRINKEREVALKLASTEILRVQKELEKVNSLLMEEKEKIILPRKNLEEERIEFEKKKKNLEIIYQRTKNAWKKMYPGQELDNVIK